MGCIYMALIPISYISTIIQIIRLNKVRASKGFSILANIMGVFIIMVGLARCVSIHDLIFTANASITLFLNLILVTQIIIYRRN